MKGAEGAASAAGAAGAATAARPAPRGLPPNERRRAPDSVLLALHVAEQALAMAGQDAAALPSVFTSAHGDLPIVDALARTLAGDPRLLSPTRFHHSVHNAPSGYWAMAHGSHAASTALAAFDHSFGAGLLEALVQAACEGTAVLLAGCDTAAQGPLASVNTSRGLLAAALVLAPRPGPASRFELHWEVRPAAPEPRQARDEELRRSAATAQPQLRTNADSAQAAGRQPDAARQPHSADEGAQADAGGSLASEATSGSRTGEVAANAFGMGATHPFGEAGANALADALPLLAALARGTPTSLSLRCGAGTALELALRPCASGG